MFKTEFFNENRDSIILVHSFLVYVLGTMGFPGKLLFFNEKSHNVGKSLTLTAPELPNHCAATGK